MIKYIPVLLIGLVPLAIHAASDGVVKGEKFSVARAKVLAQGWKPRETFETFANGTRTSLVGDAEEMYRAGYIEVQSCSGTGANYCSFNYIRSGRCLSIQTRGEFKAGEYEPVVLQVLSTCPPPEATKGSASSR